MNPNLGAIDLFVQTVDAGSLSLVAKHNGIAASTVSRQLSQLETQLGFKLLLRSTRKLSLTEEGSQYYQVVKSLINHIKHAETQINQLNAEPTGRLHISSPTLFGRHHLVPILAKFMAMYPKIQLEITLIDRPVDLIEEGIDIAIRVGALPDSSLLSRQLGKIEWVICASPDYLQQHGMPHEPMDLLQHDCLLYAQHNANNEWYFMQQGNHIKVKVPVKMRANALDAVVMAAVCHQGIVLTPKWFVSDYLTNHQLVEILSDYAMPPRPITALFTHNHRLAQKVRYLLESLTENLSQFQNG